MQMKEAVPILGAVALAAGLCTPGCGQRQLTALGPPGFRALRLHVVEHSLGGVLAGAVVAPPDGGADDSVSVSPDARRVAYVVRRAGKAFVVVNGLVGREYDEIDEVHDTGLEGDIRLPTGVYVIFSPDGRRYAYKARRGRTWRLVVDGLETQGYDEIWWQTSRGVPSTVFTHDSRHFIFQVGKDERGWPTDTIVDGIEGKVLPDSAPRGSNAPAPRRPQARGERRGGKWTMVVDGVAGPVYDWVGHCDSNAAVVSRDGRRVAYAAKRDDKKFVVIDGDEGPPYDDIWAICFSPDGRHVAYEAFTGRGDEARQLLVVDGVAGPPGGGASRLSFSPESRRVVYRIDQEQRLNAGPGAQAVVVNGVRGPWYDHVEDLTHSRHGEYLAYRAERGDRELVVVERAETPEYADILSEIHFDGPATVHFVARRHEEFLLVEVRIAEQ